MRKRCRSRVRSRGKIVLNSYTRKVAYFAYAQTTERWREWTFRTKSQRAAEQLVAAGEAEAVVRMIDGVVQVVGYRALTPTSWERPSPTTLTYGTMVAVGNDEAGAKLSGWERREILKFRVWPLIGDTRAIAVRPRLSAEERRIAEGLLARGGRPAPGTRSGALGAA